MYHHYSWNPMPLLWSLVVMVVLVVVNNVAYAQFNGNMMGFSTSSPAFSTSSNNLNNNNNNNNNSVRYDFNFGSNQTTNRNVHSVYGLTVNRLNGNSLNLTQYRNKCLLVINTASASIVAQFNMRWLNELQKRIENGSLAGRLAIIAVPSDTFGEEPLRGAALESWFELMNAKFDSLQLTDLNNSPLYHTLASAAQDLPAFNNFNKYLVWHNGSHVELFTATSGPEESWQTKVGDYETLTGRIEECVSKIKANSDEKNRSSQSSTSTSTSKSSSSSSSSFRSPSTPSLLGRFKRFAGRDWDRDYDNGQWDNYNTDADNEEDNAMNIDTNDDEYSSTYNRMRSRRSAQEYMSSDDNDDQTNGMMNGNERRGSNEGWNWDPNNQAQDGESLTEDPNGGQQPFMMEQLRKSDDDDDDNGTPVNERSSNDDSGDADDANDDTDGKSENHHHHHHHRHRHNTSSTTESSSN